MSRPSYSNDSVYIKGRSVTSVEPPLGIAADVVLVEGVTGDAMNSKRTLHLHRGSYADAASLGLSNCVRLGRVSITLPVPAARHNRTPPWARLISHAQLFANTHRRNEIVIRSGTEFSYFDDLQLAFVPWFA